MCAADGGSGGEGFGGFAGEVDHAAGWAGGATHLGIEGFSEGLAEATAPWIVRTVLGFRCARAIWAAWRRSAEPAPLEERAAFSAGSACSW